MKTGFPAPSGLSAFISRRAQKHPWRTAAALLFLLVNPVLAAPEITVEQPGGVPFPGRITGWGSNGRGQSDAPPGISGVKAIRAAAGWSVALQMDGTVRGWGDNSFNQSAAVNGWTGITQLATGTNYGLALKENGQLVTWGGPPVPAGLTDIQSIAAGFDYSAAVVTDGRVTAWDRHPGGPVPAPAGLIGVKTLAGGGRHILALKHDGTVAAWGSNTYSDGGPDIASNQAIVPAGLNGVKAVAAGYYHSLALKTDGTVVAWGNNKYGESTVPSGLNNVIAISAGGYHSLALRSDGTVVAWGANYYSQATPPPSLAGVSSLSAGGDHNLSLWWNLDFGDQHLATPTAPRTVVIKNTGTAPLTISDVTLSGAQAGDFLVDSSGMASSLPPGGSTSLRVTFTAAATGNRNAVLRISSNDGDEGNFHLVLTGYGAAAIPEITVAGNGLEIPNGNTTSREEDNTWFGYHAVDGPPVTRTFTISNTGVDPLTLTGNPMVELSEAQAYHFTVSAQPASNVVPPQGSTTFQITWNGKGFPSSATRVTVRNNDTNEGVYTFWVGAAAVYTPLLYEPTVSGITNTTATLGGRIERTSTTRGIVYALTSVNADPMLGGPGVTNIAVNGAFAGTFTMPVSGLTPGRSYSFRAYGTNVAGTGYTNTTTFYAPSIHPQEIEVRGNGQAIVSGDTTAVEADHTWFGNLAADTGSVTRTFTIANTGDDPLILTGTTPVTVSSGQQGDYSVTAQPPSTVPPQGSATFQITFTPFSGGQRATMVSIASNDADENPYTFWIGGTSAQRIPTVTSPASSGVSYTTATLGGSVLSDGGQSINSRGVLLSPALTNNDPLPDGEGVQQFTGSGGGTGTFSVSASSLMPGTAYAFKMWAENGVGRGYSAVGTFTTASPAAPTVTAPSSSSITFDSALLGGNVTAENGGAITTRGVVMALTAANPNPAIGGPDVTVLSTAGTLGAFTVPAASLSAGSSYTFRAFATNSVGTGYSGTAAFTTRPTPPPVVIKALQSSTGDSTTTLKAHVLSDNGLGISARGVVVSRADANASPFTGGAGVTQFTATGTLGDFTVSADGLLPGVTYAWKAFATNNNGATGYSPVQILTTAGGAPAQITVTTSVDENDSPAGTSVSLREAMRDAVDGASIGFAPSLDGKVIALKRGQLALSGKSLTVDASLLPRGIILDAMLTSRHFDLGPGTTFRLTKAVLQGGRAAAGQSGGSILSQGTLTLSDCTLRHNQAGNGTDGTSGISGNNPTAGGNGTAGGSGGAIRHTGAAFTAVRCRFVANAAGHGGSGGTGGGTSNQTVASGACGGNGAAAGDGGAISSTGSLTLSGCLFEGNKAGAGGYGGGRGYGSFYGTFSICTNPYSSAAADSGSGGAVSHSGALTATACSFTGNACFTGGFGGNLTLTGGNYGTGGRAGSGGALYCGGGTAFLTNCTIAENTVQDGYRYSTAGGSGANGAGLCYTGGASLRLVHCTITGNKGTPWRIGVNDWIVGQGAGVFSNGPVQCDNCLVANNRMDQGTFGSPQLKEENFAGSGTRTFSPVSPFPVASVNPPAVDPQLLPLQVSGGELPAFALLSPSPAFNAGITLTNPILTDQRGLPRPVNAPDLGALEMQTVEPGALPPQSLTFSLPASLQLGPQPDVRTLSVTTSAGLPAVYEVVSGPAILNGNTLTIYGGGQVTVRASHPGDTRWAPAADVTATVFVTPYVSPAQDTDGDGIDNLVETALQLDPSVRDNPPISVVFHPEDGTFHAVVTRLPQNSVGWIIELQTSSDLQQWDTTTPVITAGPAPGFDTADVILPAGSFARLRVTRLP